MNWNKCETVNSDKFRKLICKRCDKDLDVRSYFIPIQTIGRFNNENRGIEIHIRCINSDCSEANHKKNKDYFKPIFVGAI